MKIAKSRLENIIKEEIQRHYQKETLHSPETDKLLQEEVHDTLTRNGLDNTLATHLVSSVSAVDLKGFLDRLREPASDHLEEK